MSQNSVFSKLSTALFIIVLMSALMYILPTYSGHAQFLTVLSGSMSPQIKAGDMVVVAKGVEARDIEKGDIISYAQGENYVTHRVTGVVKENNEISFRTKGDANDGEDAGTVASSGLVGKVIFTIPAAGYFTHYARSPAGFLIFIIIPALLIILREIIKILKYYKVGQDERLY